MSSHGKGKAERADLKFNVLYYKRHTITSVGDAGVLKLKQLSYEHENDDGDNLRSVKETTGSLSFRSIKHHFTFDLNEISVEKFKGRVNHGIKIIQQQQQQQHTPQSSEGKEFIFTMVSGGAEHAYESIQQAIEEARFKMEMEHRIQPRLREMASSIPHVELSASLSVVEISQEEELQSASKRARGHPILQSCYLILLAIIKFVSILIKQITGHNPLLPKTIDIAVSNIQHSTLPILTVSETTQSRRHHQAIAKEVNSIHMAISNIQQILRRHEQSFTSDGCILDSTTVSSSFLHPREIARGITAAYRYLMNPIYYLLWKFNVPMLRPELLKLHRHPESVGEAVKKANDRVVELRELVGEVYGEESRVGLEVDMEVKVIQRGLYGVKVLASKVMSERLLLTTKSGGLPQSSG